MTRRHVTLLAVLLLVLAASAQPQFTPRQMVMNLGELMFQAPRNVTFDFTNTGDAPLLITSVRPSCGCIKVSYPEEPVEAGATGQIVAVFDAAMLGVFAKEIEVTTNASDEPFYLSFQGKVTTDPHISGDEFPIDMDNIRLLTNSIDFGDVNKGKRPVAELQILNTSRESYRAQLMHLPPYLTAQYEPQMLAGGRVGRILLTLDSEQLPALGVVQTKIYIARYIGEQVGTGNCIDVSATLLPASVQGNSYSPHITLSADTLHFSRQGGKPLLGIDLKRIIGSVTGNKDKQSRTLTITNTGRTSLTIHRLQLLDGALGASLGATTLQAGEKTKLRVTVDKSRAGNAPMRLLLITNDPQRPKVELTAVME